jgi:hypothetical protein
LPQSFIADNDAGEQVTWIHSYVGADRTMTFCIYDRPSQDAMRR